MSSGLSKKARACHLQLIEIGYEELITWFDRMALYLGCSPKRARDAWVSLGLGQIKASTEASTNTWFEDTEGRSLLTLPISAGGVWDDETPITEILAFDPERPRQVYKISDVPVVLGRGALARSRSDGSPITLFETPLDYLRAWCRYWSEQDKIYRSKPAGDATCADRDRGLNSVSFPGVCLVGYEGVLLDLLRNASSITVENEIYAKRISSQLQAEIEAEIQARKYPKILFKQVEV